MKNSGTRGGFQGFSEASDIGLALSGGGVRAMVFHMGVLRWLAETNRLHLVKHISSVSGGTLITGLVLSLCDWRWPTAAEFRDRVQPEVRRILTEVDLANSALHLLWQPRNWKFLMSRANVLAQAMEACWNIKGRLADLPTTPVWSINGTTAETGRRFRFKAGELGDYELGYCDGSDFKLSHAMAVSAAFPGLIGPLAIEAKEFKWQKRPQWGLPIGTEQPVTLPFKRLHIYDGGLYDNLGLEPLFDVSDRAFKNDIRYLICSDAGAPLARAETRGPLHPFRIKKLLEIVMDQAWALRIRPLSKFLSANRCVGAYARIGVNPLTNLERYKDHKTVDSASLWERQWLGDDAIALALAHPTTLKPMTQAQYDRLERHGYESICWNEVLFCSNSDGQTTC